MSAAERGLHWEDEGYLYVDKRGSWPKLETTQYERPLQDDYCHEALADNIPCRVRIHHYKARDGARVPYFRTEITGILNIAAELLLYHDSGLPRGQRKKQQVRKFLESLKRPRKHRKRALIDVLEIAKAIEARYEDDM